MVTITRIGDKAKTTTPSPHNVAVIGYHNDGTDAAWVLATYYEDHPEYRDRPHIDFAVAANVTVEEILASAASTALGIQGDGNRVTVFCDDEGLVEAINNLDGWKDNDWITEEGDLVEYVELLEEVKQEADRLEVIAKLPEPFGSVDVPVVCEWLDLVAEAVLPLASEGGYIPIDIVHDILKEGGVI